jgi:fucose 4-O-acetylase-like acetyltransferase
VTQPAGQTAVGGLRASSTGRSDFIDRLRVVLTALVILHHTAIAYGGSGSWFYREVRDGGTPTSLMLTVFCAVNQSFFMGMFFLLAGYFTPASLARKGTQAFLQERLLRLGVPLLVFGFLLGPLAVALGTLAAGGAPEEGRIIPWPQDRYVIGPLWFVRALLLFAVAFAAWRRVRPEPPGDPARPLPTSRAWLVAALAVGAAALGVRQIVPVGETVMGLQLGYFASYVFLFALGCVASRHRWLERVERRQARLWGCVTIITVPLLFVVAAVSGALAGKAVNFNGGLGPAAITYALWEPFVAWGVIASLLVVFRDRFNTPSAAWQRWSAQAYGALIVHAPVVVALSAVLADWKLSPLLKFVIVGAGGIAASFAVAGVLLRTPRARRIL